MMHNEKVDFRPVTPDVVTEKYTEQAVDFIRRNKDKPLLLYLPHTMPHVPLGASERWKGRSEGGLYGDVVECIDWSVGRIVEAIREHGLAKDTIVVFLSDNGPSPLATGTAGPLRGRKHMTYEGGMRVPCVMWGPGRIAAGKTCTELATSMDLLPTLAKLAGAETPRGRVIDGKDIWPLMSGQQGAVSPHEAFFYWNGKGMLEAVRAGKWKLHRKGQGKHELYDLRADVAESRNVATANAPVIQRLLALMKAHEQEIARNSRPAGDSSGGA